MKKRVFGALALAALAGPAQAALFVFQGNGLIPNFNAAAGNPPVSIDFESLSGDIAGGTINGVTFTSPNSNTLEVVDGNSTFTPGGFSGVIDATTNKLFPTSGANVLSPGGLALVPGPALAERDSLRLDFATPVSAFGLDILFQSRDCCPFVTFSVFGPTQNLLISNAAISGGTGAGGQPAAAHFWGIFSNDPSTHISRIVFTETDGDATFPDSNIGFDTFRFGVVPEPSTWAMMICGFGLAGWGLRRRRGRRPAFA